MSKIVESNISKTLEKKMKKYVFEVGVDNQKPHKKAITRRYKKGLSKKVPILTRQFRKQSNGISINELSEILDKNYGWLSNVFSSNKSKSGKEIASLFGNIVKDMNQKNKKNPSSEKKIIASLLSCVRKPISRGDYGNNSEDVIKRKGFDKLLMDTGQFYKSIIARFLK